MVPGIYYYFLFVLSTASEMAADASFESGTCRSRFICRFSCAEQQIQFGTAAGFTSKDLVWDVFYAKRKESKMADGTDFFGSNYCKLISSLEN